MAIKGFFSPVTARDLEVLDMRADGLTFSEIGAKLQNKITGKMGVTIHAANLAYRGALRRTVYWEEKRFKQEAQEYAEAYCKAVCEIILQKLA